jgi:hypothetical protein
VTLIDDAFPGADWLGVEWRKVVMCLCCAAGVCSLLLRLVLLLSYPSLAGAPLSPFSEQPLLCALILLCFPICRCLFKSPSNLLLFFVNLFPSPKVCCCFTQSLSPPITPLVTIMLFDALTVSLALHLLLGDFTQALPSSPRSPSTPSRSLHVPLLRRAVPERNDAELGVWLKQQKQLLEGKYGGSESSSRKRSSGSNLCV